MALTLATTRTRVQALIGHSHTHLTDGATSNTRIDEAITQALDRYSQDRPLRLTTAAAAVGAASYDLALPASWVEGFSEVVNIEYPVPTNRAFPAYLPRDEWGTLTSATGTTVIRSYVTRFETSSNYSIVYTARHTLNGLEAAAATTIPAGDESAFCKLAAARALMILAASTAAETDSSINVDVAGHREKSDRYRSVAAAFIKEYETEIAQDGGPPPVAFVDMRALTRRTGLFRKVRVDSDDEPTQDTFTSFEVTP